MYEQKEAKEREEVSVVVSSRRGFLLRNIFPKNLFSANSLRHFKPIITCTFNEIVHEVLLTFKKISKGKSWHKFYEPLNYATIPSIRCVFSFFEKMQSEKFPSTHRTGAGNFFLSSLHTSIPFKIPPAFLTQMKLHNNFQDQVQSHFHLIFMCEVAERVWLVCILIYASCCLQKALFCTHKIKFQSNISLDKRKGRKL